MMYQHKKHHSWIIFCSASCNLGGKKGFDFMRTLWSATLIVLSAILATHHKTKIFYRVIFMFLKF